MKKNKTLLIVVVVLVVGVAVVLATRSNQDSPSRSYEPAVARVSPRPVDKKVPVPAYQTSDEAKQLGTTLDPKQFFGKAREAYEVAKQIPTTLAQLPCYCHCDKGFGHKSLHTCFESDHASHCAVCVDEALMALKLQKDEKLTPAQVRDRIIAKYSSGDHSHGM